LIFKFFLIWHIEKIGDVVALVDFLALVLLKLKEYVVWEKGFTERHGLTAVLVDSVDAGERRWKSFSVREESQFLFTARTRVRNIP
jgi:hypothetical protein